MQLTAILRFCSYKNGSTLKIFRVMKLTAFLLTFAFLQVTARSSGQTLSLNLKNTHVKNVFLEIQKQTGLNVLIDEVLLEKVGKITLNVRDMPVEQVLGICLNNKSVTYSIANGRISVKPYSTLPFKSTVFDSAFLAPPPITGKVTDDKGQPLAGATIMVKVTGKGTKTDANGNFSINAEPNSTLIISYIGFENTTIKISNQTTISVQLKPAIAISDQIVVVGYGTQDARKVAGSISKISAEDMSKINVPTMEMALQGRAAGLDISATSGEPNSQVRIRIRGNNSISGDNQPLIVVDGFPLFSTTTTSLVGSADGSPLSFINKDDVASVEVLKDASATAIYGSRGANGVILITTKQGTAGKTKVDFSVESYINAMPKFPKMMDGRQYAEFYNMFNGTSYNKDSAITNRWVDRISQRSMGTNYNLSMSGGVKDTKYAVSGSFSNIDGILIGSGFKRGTLRSNLNIKLTQKLWLTTNLSFSQTNSNYASASNGTAGSPSAILNALRSSPLVPEAESFEQEPLSTGDYFTLVNQLTNPIMNIKNQYDKSDQKTFNANTSLDYSLFKDLKLTVRGGANYSLSNREIYWGRKTASGQLTNGSASLFNSSASNYLVEAFGTYTKKISKHYMGLVLGTSYQTTTNKSTTENVTGFLSDGLGIYGLGGGLRVNSYPYNRTDRTLQSSFFRGSYDYASRYILSLSGRSDGSSVFTQNNKYAFFPAAAVAWRVDQESFMKKIKLISELKLRIGYGLTGSQAIQPYESIPQFSFSNYLNRSAEIFGVRPLVAGNPDLKWETTKQLNSGFDLKILKGRLGLTFDYYKKTTRDLLLPFSLPLHAGISSITMNRGSLENKGIEITLSGDLIKTKNFTWSTNLNYSRNRNIILDLGGLNNVPGPKVDNGWINENVTGQFVGKPYSVFYGYKHNGLNNYHDYNVLNQPLFPVAWNTNIIGWQKWTDQNKDGLINSSDRTFIGDPNPDFTFGFNNDFTWKRFSLNMFWQGSVGGDVFNVSKVYIGTGYIVSNNTEDWWLNHWTPQNQINDPRYPYYNSHGSFKAANTYVEDGSYARLKNLSLRYSVPFKTTSTIRSLELYVTGLNLVTLTHYSGMDPEVNLFGNRNDALGVDFFSYPKTRTYTFGIKLGL